MFKEAAEQFAIDLESELGEDYTTEELLKYQMNIGILSGKGLNEYNLRNEFSERWDAIKELPLEDRQSRTSLRNDMAVENNCSYTLMYNIVRDCY